MDLASIAFLSGSPGPGELIVVFLVVLVLFGPRRLPEIARTIGKALDQLRRASQDFRDQVMQIEELPPVEPDSLDGAGAGPDAETPSGSPPSGETGDNAETEHDATRHDLAG